ncbi:MASE1 domain-containing protein [Oscillatoriales cyanobacterium LEGE 11467]|uniref:Circadian input-output histidine kinase CikA n=1 Tax=Zarconia navalis LEGE 11467 TaxID=1828826 RepID=A0A928VX34_9CYAN|nr:ATP-binding protein [Zarconia navalis]MBE9039856.1 MASE1 domain-containing protein [Zarconia navalis LEGE 11467]
MKPLDLLRYLATVTILAAAYFGLNQSIAIWANPIVQLALVGVPASIALTIALLMGKQYCPAIFLGGFFATELQGMPVGVAIALAGSSAVCAGLGVILLDSIAFRPGLGRSRDVVWFIILGGLTSTLVGATLETVIQCGMGLETCQRWQRLFWSDWIATATAILAIVPVFLTLFASNRDLEPNPYQPMRWRRLEALSLVLLLLAVSWAIFASRTRVYLASYPLEYLPFPLLVWTGLRFGQRGTVLANLLITSIAIGGIARESGPFLLHASQDSGAVISLHIFTGAISITSLVLATAIVGRQRAEIYLQQSQRNLVNAQRIAQLGSWDLNTIDRRLRWSEEMYRILDLTRQPGLPSWERYLDLIHLDDRAMVGQCRERASTEAMAYCLDYRIFRGDGEERIVRERVEIQGHLLTGTLQDITEHKRSEELRQAKEAAVAANKAKSAFLATVTHELRTPLHAIIGYSEILEEEALELGQQQFLQDLGKIKAAGIHLLSSIGDILKISKLEAGKIELHREPFEVSTLIWEVVTTVRPLIEKNSNTLEVNCDENLGRIWADRTKIQQILLNCIGNASKFTHQGRINLKVHWQMSELETLENPKETNPQRSKSIAFVVSDTGIGMTPEQLEKVFEPFSQADSSITREYAGTGLGLTITKKLCQLMGGDIAARSQRDRGSTFTISLPVETA